MRQPTLSAVAFLLAVAVALGCVGADDSSGSGDVAERSSIAEKRFALRASPAELIAAFRADAVRADLKYKGKWVRITGEVDKVATDYLGNCRVSLKSGRPTDRVTIDCDMRDEYRDEAAGVSPGQTVTILGVCAGHAVGHVVDECEFVNWAVSPRRPGAGPADFGESP